MLNDIKSTLKIVLPLRFILFIFAYTAHKLTIPRWAWPATGLWHAFETIPFFNVWSRWDSAYYVEIATQGYNHENVAFYPFYPFLIRICNVITSNGHASGLIIANLSYVLAMVILFRYVRENFDKLTAKNTILIISLFPTSFFFSAVYTESTFLLVIVLSCYFFYKNKFFLSACFGALSALTRSVGLMLFPALVLSFLIYTYKKPLKNKIKVFYFLLIPLGFAIYLYLQYLALGDPFAFLEAYKRYWPQRQFSLPFYPIFDSLRFIYKGFSSGIIGTHIIRLVEIFLSLS